jgi:uncharacterized protein
LRRNIRVAGVPTAAHDARMTGLGIGERVAALDWTALEGSIAAHGYARTGPFLAPAECAGLIALFDDDARFRRSIEMGQYRYGEGRYRYFARPLPALVAKLRRELYPRLAPIANAMMAALDRPHRYPDDLESFLGECHARGQDRPTPLLLRYREGGFNCLHRDLYGELLFPLQATLCLSAPGRDYAGGAFLLAEQRPRQQTRADAVDLGRGEMILFPTADRPVEGKRGMLAAAMRHGVARLTRGERFALGIIFHDAA